MTKKIVIDARMFGHSGIGTYLQGLLNGLRRQATSSFSFCLLGDPSVIPEGPWVVRAASSSIYSLTEQWAVPHDFKQLNGDLLHAPHYNMPVLTASRTVVTVHDLIHLKFPEQWPSPLARAYANFFFYHVVPKAKAILTVSENTKRDLMDMLSIPGDRITVTYNAVDHETFRQNVPARWTELSQLGVPKDYLLYIGNLKEFKNVQRLVEAYQRLRSLQKDAPPLVMVGRNFIPGFDKKLGDAAGIYWLGEIRRDLLPSLYQNAILFLFPSLYEGFGLPPLEAMASGTPVMCSNRASLPEVVGDAAHIIDPENVEEMAASMKRLIEDPSLRRKMSEKGLVQAERFSWQRMADQTFDVYRQSLEGI